MYEKIVRKVIQERREEQNRRLVQALESWDFPEIINAIKKGASRDLIIDGKTLSELLEDKKEGELKSTIDIMYFAIKDLEEEVLKLNELDKAKFKEYIKSVSETTKAIKIKVDDIDNTLELIEEMRKIERIIQRKGFLQKSHRLQTARPRFVLQNKQQDMELVEATKSFKSASTFGEKEVALFKMEQALKNGANPFIIIDGKKFVDLLKGFKEEEQKNAKNALISLGKFIEEKIIEIRGLIQHIPSPLAYLTACKNLIERSCRVLEEIENVEKTLQEKRLYPIRE
jgi:hypothetical protein